MTTMYRSTLDEVPQSLFALEPDENGDPRYVAFNASSCARAGLSEDDVIGKTAAEVYNRRLGKIALAHHREALRDRAPRCYELYLSLADGVERVRTVLNPVFDEKGQVVRLVGSSIVLERAVQAPPVEDDSAARRESDMNFIRLAAHDLRAPMRRILSLASMLREELSDDSPDEKEIADLLDLLEKVGAGSMTLIGDVLAHGLAAGARRDVGEFDFGELCRSVLSYLDPNGRADVTVAGGLAIGDAAATQIALRNLVENALKHSGSASAPKLDIQLRASGDSHLEVSVRDHGDGFDDPAVALINTGRIDTSRGFGILGVCNLIRERGGTICAANAGDGPGAIVSFTLPGCLLRSGAAA